MKSKSGWGKEYRVTKLSHFNQLKCKYEDWYTPEYWDKEAGQFRFYPHPTRRNTMRFYKTKEEAVQFIEIMRAVKKGDD